MAIQELKLAEISPIRRLFSMSREGRGPRVLIIRWYIVFALWAAACSGRPVAPEDAVTSSPSDIARDLVLGCKDFRLIVKDWSWRHYDSPKVYTISTLLLVDGAEECYRFPGYLQHTRLELSWSEGKSFTIYRPKNSEHAGFGPRTCSGKFCEIGDIFQTDHIVPGSPMNAALGELVSLHGLPDNACGHVYNVNLFHKTHCAPLTPP